MKIAVVTFPGSNCDDDALGAAALVGAEAIRAWHADRALPDGTDCVVLPGGFSYGDYLRTGAIARFAPIMDAVAVHAERGGLVLGICNGFQILCEAGLLPGALLPNEGLKFICRWVPLIVERVDTAFSSGFSEREAVDLPIAHFEGRFTCDDATLRELEANGQVVFRYAKNPNGAARDIAGIVSRRGNVLGMMPHPERDVESWMGGECAGRRLFEAIAGRR